VSVSPAPVFGGHRLIAKVPCDLHARHCTLATARPGCTLATARPGLAATKKHAGRSNTKLAALGERTLAPTGRPPAALTRQKRNYLPCRNVSKKSSNAMVVLSRWRKFSSKTNRPTASPRPSSGPPSLTMRGLHPNATPDAAFVKVFSDSGADGVAIRKAHALTKLSPFEPTMVGGVAPIHEAIDNTEQSEAYAQLVSMAEKMRAAAPKLSAAQAFDKVFTDPKNAKLAAKAHVRPSPTTFFPMPR
jgi:hypothetical protein